MVMKSTPRSPLRIASTSSCQKPRSPTADLMPTGRPVSAAIHSTKSSSESTSWNCACRDGEAQSLPSGMPRMPAISALTFAPGQQAAQTGLGALAELDLDGPDRRARRGGLEPLHAERAVLVAAAEVGGADLEDQVAALPVVVATGCPRRCCAGSRPASRRALRAWIALPDNDPKLMPEMFTTDAGRNALARPRAAPITLAQGIGMSAPLGGCVAGAMSAKVRCLMIG